MINKIKGNAVAVEKKKYSKLTNGWKVVRPLKKYLLLWEVVLEKNENFTTQETRDFIKRTMGDAKKIERNRVIVASIVMFVILFAMIFIALNRSGIYFIF
jgi:hypothetical protein